MSDMDLSECHMERYQNYVAHYPAGTSLKAYQHILQLAASGKFRKFDYGRSDENLRIYGTSEPPEYPIDLIEKKVLIVAGMHDRMGSIEDARKL